MTFCILPALVAAVSPFQDCRSSPEVFGLPASPSQAAIIDGGGILVQIPDPARFTFHKMIVAQERPVIEHAKRAKDLRQASLLCTILAEERLGDFADRVG